MFLDISRAYLAVIFPGAVATPQDGLADNHPGVVVGEDSGVLLVTGGVGGYFPVVDHIFGEGGVVEDNAVVAVEIFLY